MDRGGESDVSSAVADADYTPTADESPSSDMSEGPAGVDSGSRMPRRRTLWIVVGAVVIAVVIVIAASLWIGIVPSVTHSLSPPGPNVSALPYSTAYSSANATARTTASGPWALVTAIGYATLATFPLPRPSENSACGGSGSASSVPPVTAASLLAGEASLWGFGFKNPSGATLSVEVTAENSTVVGTAPASIHCFGSPRGGVGTLPDPDHLADSSRAVSLLGGFYSAFIANFSETSVGFSLTTAGGAIGSSNSTAYWEVFATPCINSTISLIGAAGDPALLAGVNATSDSVVFSHATNGLGSCLAPGTLNEQLDLGPQNFLSNFAGPYAYNVSLTVLAVNGSLYPENFTPVLINDFNSSTLPTSPLYVSTSGGTVLAEYSFTAKQWEFGASLLIQVGDQVSVALNGTTAYAAALVLEGNPPLGGTISFYLD
jgi:hypothetical protein